MTTKIVVAAPMCTPARTHVRNALQPYGVKHSIAGEYLGSYNGQFVQGLNDAYLMVAEVWVNDQAAKWAEYLLLRSGKLQLVSKPLDKRNLKWALQWGGAMPRPWVEAGCNVKALATPQPVRVDGDRQAVERRPAQRERRRRERKERY